MTDRPGLNQRGFTLTAILLNQCGLRLYATANLMMETISVAVKWFLIGNENNENQLIGATTKDQGQLCCHSYLFSNDCK